MFYATGGTSIFQLKGCLFDLYRRRFGIESSYRIMKKKSRGRTYLLHPEVQYCAFFTCWYRL